MNVKLKVVQGKLKGKDGESAGLEVEIAKTRFVIGTASDCNMRCPSSTISEHHCELLKDGDKVLLRDLGSDSGTFLNDEQIASATIVQAGDRMRVGRLEFDIVIEDLDLQADPVDDLVSEMLVQADEEERASRLADPDRRQFHLDPNEANVAEGVESEEEDKLTRLRKKVPEKKPPGKLPPAPSITAESTISAAEQTLEKILEKPKTPRS